MSVHNVNDMVEVELTQHGLHMLQRNPDAQIYLAFNLDSMTFRVPLFILMNLFGPHMTMGFYTCFAHNEIHFDENPQPK